MDKRKIKKNEVGRPVKYTKEKLEEINSALKKYVDEEDIPILAEFAYQNDINRTKLYEFDELKDAIKKCVTKKEANLERFGLLGQVNTTIAIFSLKQLGWTDGRYDKKEIQESETNPQEIIKEWMKANLSTKVNEESDDTP